MTMLPTAPQAPRAPTAAMFSWQAPLAALFGGLSAAGQPGGWSNFGAGVANAQQNWQGQQMDRERFRLLQEQAQREQDRFQDEQHRANKEAADAEARKSLIARILGGGQQVQAPNIQTTGGQSSAVLGVGTGRTGARPGEPPRMESSIGSIGPGGGDRPPEQLDSGAPAAPMPGQSAILSAGMTPQQSALFSQYAQIDPEGAFAMLVERGFAEPEAASSGVGKIMEDYRRGLIDEPTRDALLRKETYIAPPPQGAETWSQVTINGRPMLQSSRGDIKEMPGEGGAPFEGNAMDAQARNIVLQGDPNSQEYAAAYAYLSEPKITFDPTTNRTVVVTPPMGWARPPAGSAGVAAPQQLSGRAGPTIENMLGLGAQQPQAPQLPGLETFQVPGGATVTSSPGGVKLTAEESTKVTAMQEGVKDVEAAIGLLAPSGEIDESAVAAGQSMLGVQGMPFTGGRDARQKMQRGIESILRAMTGAAAPESEVDRYMGMFFPSPLDSDAVALDKLNKAKSWLQGTLNQIAVGRPQLQGQSPSGGAVPPPPAGFRVSP